MGQENGDYVILYTGQIKIISHVNGPRKWEFFYFIFKRNKVYLTFIKVENCHFHMF